MLNFDSFVFHSAHWCGPCRHFTPVLSTFYNTHRESKNFEIVFISSDRDQASFDEYYGEMPWVSLPFSERDTKAALSKKFKVNGIPTFILLDAQGNVVCADARDQVGQDSGAEEFPWPKKSFAQSLGETLVTKTGPVSASSILEANDYVFLYFSAHWCPPCRGFTPKLVQYYNRHHTSKKFEVIFVSGDNEQSEFDEYYGEMPWATVAFGAKNIGWLNSAFEVEGIPRLVLLDKQGNVVNSNARSAVESDTEGRKFPYPPAMVENLNQSPEYFGGSINDTPSLVAFVEAFDDDQQEEAREEIAKLAQPIVNAAKASGESPELAFFIVTATGGLGDRVRSMIGKTSASKTVLALLDIPDNGAYYTSSEETEVNESTVQAFLDAYKNKTLTRQQLSR